MRMRNKNPYYRHYEVWKQDAKIVKNVKKKDFHCNFVDSEHLCTIPF
jgi:hypothetical protein